MSGVRQNGEISRQTSFAARKAEGLHAVALRDLRQGIQQVTDEISHCTRA